MHLFVVRKGGNLADTQHGHGMAPESHASHGNLMPRHHEGNDFPAEQAHHSAHNTHTGGEDAKLEDLLLSQQKSRGDMCHDYYQHMRHSTPESFSEALAYLQFNKPGTYWILAQVNTALLVQAVATLLSDGDRGACRQGIVTMFFLPVLLLKLKKYQSKCSGHIRRRIMPS